MTKCKYGGMRMLGGRFGPEKKYLAPPPKKIPQFAADTLPHSRLLPFLEPHPFLGFSIRNRPPPPPGASDCPIEKKRKISEASTKYVCVCTYVPCTPKLLHL